MTERKYINKAEKEIIVCLAACKGFLEVTQAAENPMLRTSLKDLRTANTLIGKAIDRICEGVDEDQYMGILRFTNNSELMVYPKSSPINKNEYWKVERKELEELLQDSVSDCMLCMYDAKEIKKCRKRKLLLRCGLVPQGNGECPFMR